MAEAALKAGGQAWGTSTTGPDHVAREPSQSRGHARVESLLKAASATVAEEGLAGLTMHGVARRSGTSIGSLYHFFPDRDSLLMGLVRRHEAAIAEINARMLAVPGEVWRQFSVPEAVNYLVTPYVDYTRQHPDFFPLMHDRRSPENEATFTQTLRRMIDARLPNTKPAARDRHAAMLHAIALGVMRVAFIVEPERLAFYMDEIPRVMAAYLASLEAEAGL